MAKNKKRDPRTDPKAGLSDFVRRVNRMGFPNSHRVEYPIWTVKDIQWAAVLTEQLFHELKEFAYGRHDLDPLERVLRSRMAVIGVAHTMSQRTNNIAAKAIVRGLPRIAD
jgi:hypothetical protein